MPSAAGAVGRYRRISGCGSIRGSCCLGDLILSVIALVCSFAISSFPIMKDNSLNAFFVGSLIASAVGAVMLLVDDFAGWYYQISYAGVPTDRYEYIGIFSVYFPVAAVLAGALFYSGYVSYLALRSDDLEPSAKLVRRAYSSSVAAFGATAVLAIIFAIIMSTQDVEDWWLGGGFYGAAVGSVLSAILLKLGLNKIAD